MSTAVEPLMSVPFDLSEESRGKTACRLQGWLVDLIALSLRLKQGHWNLQGSRFKSIHEQLDEILDDVREASDAVAERIVTLGASADGRPRTVAEGSTLDDFPPGVLSVEQTLDLVCADLSAAARHGRRCLDELGELDPISEDLVIGFVAAIEKHHWMLRSQRESPERS